MIYKIIVLLMLIYTSVFPENRLLGIGIDLQDGFGVVGLSLRGKTKSNFYLISRFGISPSFYNEIGREDDALYGCKSDLINEINGDMDFVEYYKKPENLFSIDFSIGYDFKFNRFSHKPLLGFTWFHIYKPISFAHEPELRHLKSEQSGVYLGYELSYSISELFSVYGGLKLLLSDRLIHASWIVNNDNYLSSHFSPTLYFGLMTF